MRRLLPTSGVLALTLGFTHSARSESPVQLTIEHAAGTCAVAGVWPQIEARVSPPEKVRGVRVLFHATDSGHWYSVDMRKDGETWIAPLPRPKSETARLAYFVAASGEATSARLPETSAFVVDVQDACGSGALPRAEKGPVYLGLVRNAPRTAPGFDTEGVQAYLEGVMDDPPTSSNNPWGEGWLLPSDARVRVRTVSPSIVKGTVVFSDKRSVTTTVPNDVEVVTLAREGEVLEGTIWGAEGNVVLLWVDGESPVRIRHSDIVRMEYYKNGSTGRGIVGGLAGMGAGFLTAVLVCVSTDACNSSTALWGGLFLGGALGWAAGGAGGWEPIPVLTQKRVALAVKRVPGGGMVGVRVTF